jgi:N-glycosylase/DNA lyase
VTVPAGVPATFAFPGADRLAAIPQRELRKCGMGFRAPYLAETARLVAGGAIVLAGLRHLPLSSAREALMQLPGVGRKIADCVLLFGVGHVAAFPVDVWVLRTLRELYFEGREAPMREVIQFAETHFGPQAGYAQQYLFHAARTRAGRVNPRNAR